MSNEVKIEKVDNGYIVHAPFPHASYSTRRVVFRTFDEVVKFITSVFHEDSK